MYELKYVLAYGFIYKKLLYQSDFNKIGKLPENWKFLKTGNATFIYIDPKLYMKDILKVYEDRLIQYSDYDDFQLSFEGLYFNTSKIKKKKIKNHKIVKQGLVDIKSFMKKLKKKKCTQFDIYFIFDIS